MSTSFNAHQGLVIVSADVVGPRMTVAASLAVDIGATRTLINPGILLAAGYSLANAPSQGGITTASGVIAAPRLTLNRLTTLGHHRTSFPIIAYTLPPQAAFDGLLGLDFFRGLTLTLDFRSGQIILV